MNEFFHNRLNTAHAMIDEGSYDEAVELLKNLNQRIHDTETSVNINTTTTDIDKQYTANLMSLANKAGDPYESFKNALALKKWRSQQYLRFYDNLLIKHEL
jgi:hypothetical protein